MPRLRALTVALVAIAVLALLTMAAPTVLRDAAVASTPGGSLDDLCGAVAMVVAWVLSAWLTMGVLVAAGAALPGVLGDRLSRVATRLAPVPVRRAVALAIGMAVVAPVATAQAIAPGPDPRYPVLDRVVVQPVPAAPVAPWFPRSRPRLRRPASRCCLPRAAGHCGRRDRRCAAGRLVVADRRCGAWS